MSSPQSLAARLTSAFFTPQAIERLAWLRILLPLAILGFLSSRIQHADHWIGDAGFSVPDVSVRADDTGDFRQPVYLAPLPAWAAWSMSALIVVSGISVSVGLFTRIACATMGALLAYVALADRLATFTVTKLGAVLMIALTFTACGRRYALDAFFSRRKDRKDRGQKREPELAPAGDVRFFQLLLVVFYASSGLAKARTDWLHHRYVLWTHLHDSYQTAFTVFVANAFPAWAWTVLQATTLAYELFAPIWFSWSKSRPYAVVYGLAMHAMIGLMFGPVIWFSLLMMSLVVAGFAPEAWLKRAFGGAARIASRLRPARAEA